MEKETKLKQIKVLSYVLLVSIFIVGIYFYSNMEKPKAVRAEIITALTEKQDYFQTENLKVEIENKEGSVICFSSCYPYVIQAKTTGWNMYPYLECQKDNIAETCINPNQLKAFEINLNGMFLEPATHRLAIPACVDCAIGEQFRVDKIIYSNEFEIKK